MSQDHLSWLGLFKKPTTGWFCFDECKKNGGYKLGRRKVRRSLLGDAHNTARAIRAERGLIRNCLFWKVGGGRLGFEWP